MSFKGHKRKITMSGCSELNMYVDEIPSELSSLEKLEQIRIAQRICDQTYNQLPHPPNRSCIIMLNPLTPTCNTCLPKS